MRLFEIKGNDPLLWRDYLRALQADDQSAARLLHNRYLALGSIKRQKEVTKDVR